ncbi:MAG: hypothetical protein LW875_04150 [Proteobacteria bacterium]|jgi:hypothetical protein|nr:hypothetical protein [Pseudomonadota bacterium]
MKDFEFYKKMPRLIFESMGTQGNPYFKEFATEDLRAEQFKLCWILSFPVVLWGLVQVSLFQLNSWLLLAMIFFAFIWIFRQRQQTKAIAVLFFCYAIFTHFIERTLLRTLVEASQAEVPPTWLLFVADNSLTVIFAGISFGVVSLAISRLFGLTLLLATPLLLGGLASLEFCVAMVLGEAIFFGLMLMTRRRWEAFARERFYRGLMMLGSAVLVLGLGFPWVKALSFTIFGDEFIPALRRWQFVLALAVFWLVDLGVASVFMHYRSAWQRTSKSESKN